MRIRLLLLVIVIVSCSFTGCDKPVSQSTDVNKSRSADPVPDKIEFDPHDFEATLRWIASEYLAVATADEERNELLANETMEEVNAKFAKYVGQEVRWRIEVSNVENNYVRLKRYNLGKYVPKNQWSSRDEMVGFVYLTYLQIAALDEKSAGAIPSNGAWNGISGNEIQHETVPPGLSTGGLAIGKVISKDQAKRLTKGQHVVVTGRLAYIVGSGEYPSAAVASRSRMVGLCIEEAKASTE